MQEKITVLFVCMGNICRSPTAEGVFRYVVDNSDLKGKIQTDSAGTHAYHVGEPPDRRAQATAITRGIDISDLRARKVNTDDFERFDYVIAMDKDNLSILLSHCPEQHKDKVHLFLNFAKDLNEQEVPDPYYGGQHGFERVFDMVEAASNGLLEDILLRLNSK
ncbi:MAG: low molecular weight protein-tyrosine-phosphatase [Thioalkalispiraceae bacterium]|jgi:protein-tyrosine phosphatase